MDDLHFDRELIAFEVFNDLEELKDKNKVKLIDTYMFNYENEKRGY